MSTTTVGQLIEMLAEFNPDSEVRLATQPSWPLAFNIGPVDEVRDPYTDEPTSVDPNGVPIVWIAEGGPCDDSPYAPRSAWEGR